MVNDLSAYIVQSKKAESGDKPAFMRLHEIH